MTEEEWLCTDRVDAMLRYVRSQRGRLEGYERRLRLLSCAALRREELPDDRLLQYLDIAERYADGEVSRTTVEQYQWELAVTFFHWLKSPAVERCHQVLSPRAHRAEHCYDHLRKDDPFRALIRDIFGNPFRPGTFSPEWRTDTALSLARGMYESRDFSAMPILADALQDAGCDNDDILNHCRDAKQVHVRGCWVVDLVLGKE